MDFAGPELMLLAPTDAPFFLNFKAPRPKEYDMIEEWCALIIYFFLIKRWFFNRVGNHKRERENCSAATRNSFSMASKRRVTDANCTSERCKRSMVTCTSNKFSMSASVSCEILPCISPYKCSEIGTYNWNNKITFEKKKDFFVEINDTKKALWHFKMTLSAKRCLVLSNNSCANAFTDFNVSFWSSFFLLDGNFFSSIPFSQ